MYQKKKKSSRGCSPGSLETDFLISAALPDYEPDPHDYEFLSEYQDFSISRHARLLNKILKHLDEADLYRFTVFDSEAADAAARVLCTAAGIPMYQKVLMFDSIFPRFASREITKSLIFDMSLIIAGNMDIINNEQVIVQNYDLKYPAWVPMTIKNLRESFDESSHNLRVDFFADAGIFAGAVITKSMSPKFMRFVLRQIGMSRRVKFVPRDLFGTKMSVLVMREGREIVLSEFNTSSSQESYNKGLFKVRYGDRPCHKGLYVACGDCRFGIDECDYAVYKETEPEEENENDEE